MVRLICICTVLACLVGVSGCANMYYGEYVEKAQASIVAGEKTKQEGFKTLTKAIEHGNAETKGAATMAAALLLDRHKTILPEAPKESSVEKGIGGLLKAVPGVAQIYGFGYLAEKMQGNQTTNQTVSGSGAGGSIGHGQANPATSPPTIVEQPPPIIVGTE